MCRVPWPAPSVVRLPKQRLAWPWLRLGLGDADGRPKDMATLELSSPIRACSRRGHGTRRTFALRPAAELPAGDGVAVAAKNGRKIRDFGEPCTGLHRIEQ